MSLSVIQASGLGFRYGKTRALDGVTLDVRQGECFAVVGPNGGGKSTLFRLLSTASRANEGELTLFGSRLDRDLSSIRARIGVVFQSPAFDKKLTVLENLVLHGRLYGMTGKTCHERARALATILRIEGLLPRYAGGLSGGEKRRADLARGLLHSPELLLLDEPTAGLDPVARHELWQHLERLRQDERLTIVLTTHLLDEAESCDRVMFLLAGKRVALGTPAELRAGVGPSRISIRAKDPSSLAPRIANEVGIQPKEIDGELWLDPPEGSQVASAIWNQFASEVTSVTLGKPTLEDFFVKTTGRQWREASRD